LEGLRVSPTAYRPFVFSNLNLTDEEETVQTLGASKIGQIEVTITFVKILGEKPTTRMYEVPAEQKFNEKAKKGIDHQTRFGDIVQTRAVHTVKTKSLGKPAVRFIFRYRPLEVLRAHGIAPQAAPVASASSSQRTRKREPFPEDLKPRINEVLVLSDSEDEHPARKQRKRVKRENNVKREPLNILSGEVIDLT